MGISKTYDFLTRTFAAHERRQLNNALGPLGKTVSKAEGKKLGPNADTFDDFYKNHKAPGKAVQTSDLRAFATTRFEEQMKALAASLDKGPGVDGFKLAKDVVDNWQAFVSRQELFKFAELPAAHKVAVIANEHWKMDEIPEPPAAAAVQRSKVANGKLPATIKSVVAELEAKHYVSQNPASHPPSSSDIFQIKLSSANQVKVDDVVVGYALHFSGGGGTMTVDALGAPLTKGALGLYEVSPNAAVGFAALTPMQKIERLMSEELAEDTSQDWGTKTLAQTLQAIGSGLTTAAIAAKQKEGVEAAASSIEGQIYFSGGMSLSDMGVNITPELLTSVGDYGGLIAHIKDKAIAAYGPSSGDEVEAALGNGWADTTNPSVSVYREDGQIVGAKFRWSASVDGDHDYWTEYFYDHTTKKFIGGASGGYETDSDVWED